LGPGALEVLRLYLRNRAKQFKSEESIDWVPLLVNKDGKRISQRSVRRKMDLYLRQIGFDMEISPHTLRHTCAVHMLKAGADPEEVRQRLGHQSMQQVRQYQAMLER
jgi:integrase/recombinase XerC